MEHISRKKSTKIFFFKYQDNVVSNCFFFTKILKIYQNSNVQFQIVEIPSILAFDGFSHLTDVLCSNIYILFAESTHETCKNMKIKKIKFKIINRLIKMVSLFSFSADIFYLFLFSNGKRIKKKILYILNVHDYIYISIAIDFHWYYINFWLSFFSLIFIFALYLAMFLSRKCWVS